MEAYRPPDREPKLTESLPAAADRWQAVLRVGNVLLFFYPILAASLPYLFYLVFGALWGRFPNPYADDLKTQSLLFTYPYTLAILLIASHPIFIAAELVVSWYDPKGKVYQRLIRLLFYVGQCILAWFIISSDNRINQWFFD